MRSGRSSFAISCICTKIERREMEKLADMATNHVILGKSPPLHQQGFMLLQYLSKLRFRYLDPAIGFSM